MGSKKAVRWGILGAAWIAKERVIPAIKEADNAEIVAIASRNEEKARGLAEIYNIPHVFQSYEELLKDPGVDAVYIPLPNHLHAKWTKRAAAEGKHVLCEKPAALNVNEIEEMVEVCNQNRVLFMEAFAFRCHPEWHRIMGIINSGEIGEVRTVRVHYSTLVDNENDIRFNPSMGGGALYDLGCYCINAIRLIMGAEPEVVRALANFSTDQVVDKSLSAVMKFQEGRLAHFDCSLDTVYRQFIDITGTKGAINIHWPFQHPHIVIQKNGEEVVARFRKQVNPYALQIEHFGSCILTGQSPINDSKQSIANMKVIEAIYKSANEVI